MPRVLVSLWSYRNDSALRLRSSTNDVLTWSDQYSPLNGGSMAAFSSVRSTLIWGRQPVGLVGTTGAEGCGGFAGGFRGGGEFLSC